MYATLFKFENLTHKSEKNWAVCASLLERKFSNTPLCSVACVCVCPYQQFFAVLSEDKETYKNVVKTIEDFIECLESSPNWAIEITTSPEI